MDILELRHVARSYPTGDGDVAALKDVSLIVQSGESLAIMGPSGSGKSTLMNLLGLLDRPTSGVYRVFGQDTSQFDADELAAIRRERFGFVFQHYNLLPELTAVANVEVPAVYAGASQAARRARARELLSLLNLDDRLMHKPAQLSGGQQQRVSIARALMNAGSLILADEPTGALDSHAGEEVLRLLKALNAAGHTLIIVTHEPKVAAHCERIVTLADGELVSDVRRTPDHLSRATTGAALHARLRAGELPASPRFQMVGFAHRIADSLTQALFSMGARRLRTFLATLSIVIGIASVSCVVALGVGGRERALASIREIGTNTLDIYPGEDYGVARAREAKTLIPDDAKAIAMLPGIDSVTPFVSTEANLRTGDLSAIGTVSGVGEDYFRVHNIAFSVGVAITRMDVEHLRHVLVIDDSTREKLFPHVANPVGRVIFVGHAPFEIVGVTMVGSGAFHMARSLTVWAPYTAVLARLTGSRSLSSITARVSDAAPIETVAHSVSKLLLVRHGEKDFLIQDTDSIRRATETSARALTLVVAGIALISQVVGGVGVMNIMLASVSERRHEIGIRAAVGARQSDILMQILIESVLICLVGGALGVVLALVIGVAFHLVVPDFPMVFSTATIVAAIAISTLTGLAFGLFPARRAAQLSPVDALARK